MKLLFRALEKAGTLNLHTIFLLQYPFGKIPGSVCCKPVDHVFVWTVEVYIGNAYELHSRLGKNTDKQDTAWIAELLAHGLIWSSFVTPPNICALRDVTRTRVALVQTRSQSKNRVHKLLEDTNLTLGSVVSDLFGGTVRHMLAALVAGRTRSSGVSVPGARGLEAQTPAVGTRPHGPVHRAPWDLIKPCIISPILSGSLLAVWYYMRPSDAALGVAVTSVCMQDRKIQINLPPVSDTTREKLSQPGKAMFVIPIKVTLSSVDKYRNIQVVLPQVPRSILEKLAKSQEAKLIIKP